MVRFFRSSKSSDSPQSAKAGKSSAPSADETLEKPLRPASRRRTKAQDVRSQTAGDAAKNAKSADSPKSSIPPKHTLLAALGAVILAAGCAAGVGNPERTTSDGQMQISTEAERAASGVYEGVIPAADGPGIRVALYVRAVGTYTRIDTYLEKNLTTVEDGRWTVKGNRIQMTPLDPKKPIRWAERDGNELRLMDIEGNPITGALADNYVLRKN